LKKEKGDWCSGESTTDTSVHPRCSLCLCGEENPMIGIRVVRRGVLVIALWGG
jgi:hypothetical protein